MALMRIDAHVVCLGRIASDVASDRAGLPQNASSPFLHVDKIVLIKPSH